MSEIPGSKFFDISSGKRNVKGFKRDNSGVPLAKDERRRLQKGVLLEPEERAKLAEVDELFVPEVPREEAMFTEETPESKRHLKVWFYEAFASSADSVTSEAEMLILKQIDRLKSGKAHDLINAINAKLSTILAEASKIRATEELATASKYAGDASQLMSVLSALLKFAELNGLESNILEGQ